MANDIFELVRLLPPPVTKPPEEVHKDAMARGAKCRECPLFGCDRGPVLGTIKQNAPVIVVGEAPGPTEVKAKIGFAGASGSVVNDALREGGLDRSEVSVSNTILCQPPADGNFSDYIAELQADHRKLEKRWEKTWLGRPGDQKLNGDARTKMARKRWAAACTAARDQQQPEPVGPPQPPVLPQEACRPRLERDLREANAQVTLAVGKQAQTMLAEVLQLKNFDIEIGSMRKQHGAPILLPEGKVLISTYHPAFAMRENRQWMPVIRENIARAARIAKRNGLIDWSQPAFILDPSEETILRVLKRFRDLNVEVTVDIETDGIDPHVCEIRCIGLGATIDGREEVIVVPTRHMDGIPWWPADVALRIAYALREIFDNSPLIFQNGQYDSTVLLRKGLMTNRQRSWTDTLLLHHNTTDCDLPHDLGFIVRRYFEVPLWKVDIDHKSTDRVNDGTLHLYNAKDILGTMRVVRPLREQIELCSTQSQNHTDYCMLPRVRDMSEMGLHVNEWQRGKFSSLLNKHCVSLKRQFQELAGVPSINPRSNPQLQELLYVDWGYQPVIATDGFDWDPEEDEVEDGSTGNGALTRLMAQRAMDPRHVKAINTLLEFRANDKLRGTYTDNLQTYPVDWSPFDGTLCEIGWADEVIGSKYDEGLDADVELIVLPRRRGLSLARTTFKGHVVPTGRLASGTPVNFQNIPKQARGGLNLRNMFVAPPGHVFVGADYEQIEARLYAIIARDRLLLDAIQKGLDLHTLNCASLLATADRDVMATYHWLKARPKDELGYWRTVAKRFCFLKIYGGGRDKLYSVMAADRKKSDGTLTFPNLDEKDCFLWSDNWDKYHPETEAWHKLCHAAFEQYGFTGVPMIDYRRRFFPGGASQKNAIPNLTIQGSAASICNQALLRICEEIPYRSWSRYSGVVCQIHDFIMVCVPESRAEEAAEIVRRCMYYEYMGMKFVANPEVTWTLGAQ